MDFSNQFMLYLLDTNPIHYCPITLSVNGYANEQERVLSVSNCP